jgi:hypothetical protein
MAKGVQFRGWRAVVTAFENIKLANFAVLYDKLLQCKYQDDNEIEAQALLTEYLKSIEKYGSSAVYTLHVFERPKGAKTMRIKPSTEPDYAFNFTLFDELENPNERGRLLSGYNATMNEKILALEAKLAKYEEEEPEAVGGIQGFLNGIIEDPRAKQFIQDKIFGLVDQMISPTPPAQQQQAIPMYPTNNPGAMGKVGAVDENSPILIDLDQHAKLQQACELLARIDPALGDNLLSIAEMARTKPEKYKTLISMLKTFV